MAERSDFTGRSVFVCSTEFFATKGLRVNDHLWIWSDGSQRLFVIQPGFKF